MGGGGVFFFFLGDKLSLILPKTLDSIYYEVFICRILVWTLQQEGKKTVSYLNSSTSSKCKPEQNLKFFDKKI